MWTGSTHSSPVRRLSNMRGVGSMRIFGGMGQARGPTFLDCFIRPKGGPFVRNFCGSGANIRGTLGSAGASFEVGEFATLTRTFEKADVEGFAKVSGDYNPIHFDEEFAKKTRFGSPIVHGMLVGSLFSTLIATQVPGAIYVSQNLCFKAPVHIGDEIVAQITVQEASPVKLVCKTTVRTTKLGENNGNLCIDGHALVMLPRNNIL